MNSNSIINNTQEKEINKILQEGIDKSLLYIQSLNVPNSIDSYKYSTQPNNDKSSIHNKTRTKKFQKTNTLKKNSKQKLRPLSATEKNIQKYYSTMPKLKSKSNNKNKKIKKKRGFLIIKKNIIKRKKN